MKKPLPISFQLFFITQQARRKASLGAHVQMTESVDLSNTLAKVCADRMRSRQG